MKKLLTAVGLGVLGLLAPAAQAAAGDITVRITDMYDQPLTAGQGAKASLVGIDELGAFSLGPKYADGRGMVQFSAQELEALTEGNFSFVVYTSGANTNLQGKLYDPFGKQWTYIQYRADATYDFTVPTPTAGRAQPKVSWNKMNLKMIFDIDWGNRRNRDFWFTRVVLQKSATEQAHAGSDYGLVPVISDAWIRSHGLTADDGGLAQGQTGTLRLSGEGYDESFLARKSGTGPSTQYQVFLVNCLWSRDLAGVYDPDTKSYTVEFDPATVFADSSAPAWSGPAMKKEIGYFAALQAETWLVHSAGANGGLACSFGPPVAQSLLLPLHIDVNGCRIYSATASAGAFTFEVYGLPGPFRVEVSSDLKTWSLLATETMASPPFVFAERDVPIGPRFYRATRVSEPLRLAVSSWTKGTCTLTISGPPGLSTIEYTSSLSNPRWTTLLSTNITRTPFVYTDANARDAIRFYRIRQP